MHSYPRLGINQSQFFNKIWIPACIFLKLTIYALVCCICKLSNVVVSFDWKRKQQSFLSWWICRIPFRKGGKFYSINLFSIVEVYGKQWTCSIEYNLRGFNDLKVVISTQKIRIMEKKLLEEDSSQRSNTISCSIRSWLVMYFNEWFKRKEIGSVN